MNDFFPNEAAKRTAIEDAESLSRRDESVANVLRGRAMRGGEQYQGLLDDASAREAETAAMVRELQARGFKVDKSGASMPLSDSFGNYAPNLQVATTGGVNVEASSSTSSGDMAESVEDVSLYPAGSGVTDGNQVIGDPADGDPIRTDETRDGVVAEEVRRAVESTSEGGPAIQDASLENPMPTPDLLAATSVEGNAGVEEYEGDASTINNETDSEVSGDGTRSTRKQRRNRR
jgi:hypothetical protein